MSIKHHYVKCETDVFQDVDSGSKKFELRKNDRGYKRFDMVHLEEWVNGEYTGRSLDVQIRYILYGPRFGIPEGYCIFNW